MRLGRTLGLATCRAQTAQASNWSSTGCSRDGMQECTALSPAAAQNIRSAVPQLQRRLATRCKHAGHAPCARTSGLDGFSSCCCCCCLLSSAAATASLQPAGRWASADTTSEANAGGGGASGGGGAAPACCPLGGRELRRAGSPSDPPLGLLGGLPLLGLELLALGRCQLGTSVGLLPLGRRRSLLLWHHGRRSPRGR